MGERKGNVRVETANGFMFGATFVDFRFVQFVLLFIVIVLGWKVPNS